MPFEIDVICKVLSFDFYSLQNLNSQFRLLLLAYSLWPLNILYLLDSLFPIKSTPDHEPLNTPSHTQLSEPLWFFGSLAPGM